MRPSSTAVNAFLLACVAVGTTTARDALAARPAFVYLNANPPGVANSVAAFHVDKDGRSTPIAGSPYATGGLGLGLAPAIDAPFAHRIATAPARNLLFAANDGTGTIAAFAVDPLTGVLTAVPGSPFRSDNWPAVSGISIAISNDGRFLHASASTPATATTFATSTLVSFAIAANGSLAEIFGPQQSGWTLPGIVGGIAVAPDNSRVFANTADTVYILDTANGGLTFSMPAELSIGSRATDLRLDALGSRLWVGTQDGGILAYTFTGGDAAVAPGAPYFSAISGLNGLTVDFYGRTLFAFSPTLPFPVLVGAHTNADASLTLGPNSPQVPTHAPTSAALIPDGSLLFSADAQGTLDAWSTDDSGLASHAAGYPLATGAPSGYPALATFPDKTPTPAPAGPPWLPLVLGGALLLLGARALSALPARD